MNGVAYADSVKMRSKNATIAIRCDHVVDLVHDLPQPLARRRGDGNELLADSPAVLGIGDELLERFIGERRK